MHEGLPVVEGIYLNGRGPYRFVLDTGSAVNQLDPAIARELVIAPTFKSELVSSTGRVPVLGSDRVSVALDGVSADNQMFFFVASEALKFATIKIEGLLGQEFLSHFDYLLDLKEGRLEFGSLDHPLHDGARTHFTMVEGRPVIATSLGKMVMDSGADAVVRFRVPGGATTRQLRTLTGMTAVGTVRSTLVIEQRKFWQGEAVAVPQPHESGVDGLLPLGLFDKVYVNNSESYVILE